MKRKYGVDVSHWNSPDFRRLKEEFKIDFAVLKLGTFGAYGFYPDVAFQSNANMCEIYKIPYGAYVYLNSTAFTSPSDYTKMCVDSIRYLWGRKLDYPLYLDVEENNGDISLNMRTERILSILDFWETFGFYAGIYASEKSGFGKIFELSDRIKHYTFWVANWSAKPELSCGMWQCASGNSDKGLLGLDKNVCYVGFPTAIRKAGLNGYWI